eukprot:GILI01008078.1.p1 GENE.GILI01008078.1~~GILI01008078.1.p1  ORF type:complete len:342 (+),score=122.94 GILI01008078.1:76-1101(+)
MAKEGEGDPRWIVANRDDGKNVNSWHWEERDLSKASHEALKELFIGKQVPNEGDVKGFTFTELSEVDGDITVAQRKGKIMCYFEVKMTAKWEAMVGDSKIEGKLAATDIEHDNYTEDFDVKVTTVERSAAAAKAEAVAQKGGRKLFRSVTKGFFDDLFKQHNVGTKVPTSGTPSGATSSATSAPPPAAKPAPTPIAKPTPTASVEATSIQWVIDWSAPVQELFRTFTDEARASAYTRAPAKIDAQPEGKFEFLGGAISGHYNEVVENKKLIMQWRLGSWPAGQHSSVVMDFVTEEHGRTRLNFAQAGIPSSDVERVKQGWTVNFFEPIKMMLGFQFTWVKQ